MPDHFCFVFNGHGANGDGDGGGKNYRVCVIPEYVKKKFRQNFIVINIRKIKSSNAGVFYS